MDYVATIGIICTVLGAIIGYLGYKRNYSSDLKKDSRKQSVIETKLDYIGKGVDDIRLDIKATDRRVDKLNERVIKVEESAKSAHKRIDDIAEKID